MTGFARVNADHEDWRWTWEMRSVNARGMELRFRLPPGYDEIEPELRKAVQSRLARGSVGANLQLAGAAGAARLQINEGALADAIAAVGAVSSKLRCDPPRAEGILGLRGVLETLEDPPGEEAREALLASLKKSFDEALEALIKSRRTEGAAMAGVITEHVNAVETLTSEAAGHATAKPEAIRDRIAAQLAELLEGASVPEDRLAQEAAMLAIKADVREELDRLKAHIGAARALIKKGGVMGREFDFLLQEFNRETNTLCSKAQDMELKSIGLALKKVIDQLREQIQNIE
ncbi:MAG: YicC/YloC family endoribonuclease [Pseudomonadota bacterium]